MELCQLSPAAAVVCSRFISQRAISPQRGWSGVDGLSSYCWHKELSRARTTGISKPRVAGRGFEQKAGLEVCEENSKRLTEGKPLMCRGRGACVHCPAGLTSLSLSRRRTDRRQHPTPHDSAHRGTARRTCQHHQLGLRTPSAPA